MSQEESTFPVAAVAALEQGNKIEAIKILRMTNKLDLKEAKDLVEEYVEKNPSLKARLDQANAAAGGSAIRWIVTLVLIGALIYFLFGHK